MFLAIIMYYVLEVQSIFSLCVSSQPRLCMNVIIQEVQSIFVCVNLCFQLATTMYEHYFQEEPVNLFIMFIYLTTTTYACYWPSAAVYIFSLCASSQPRSCMNALPWWFGLFFYCASSQPRPCKNVTVQEVHTIFLLCVSSQPRPCMNILVQEVRSIFF